MYVQTVRLISFCSRDRDSIQFLRSRACPSQLLGISAVFMKAGDGAFLFGDFFGYFCETSGHYGVL